MKGILYLASIVLIVSCGQQGGSQSEKAPMSDYEAYVYESTMDKVKSLEGRMSELSSASFEEVEKYLQDVDGVKYHNDTTDMTASGIESCLKLENRVKILKRDAQAAADSRLRTMLIPVEVNDDCLLEATTTYPVYLEKGDVLYFKIGLQKPGAVKLYNADAKSLIKTYSKTSKVSDSLRIANKGIYLVDVLPGGTQYASVDITYRMADHAHPVKAVKSEEVEGRSGGFRVVGTKGVNMRAAFDQPRKFTLSSQFKSTFSSAAKSIAVVAVQIPSGATDVLYNLRISTSEQDRSSDGKFPDNMNLAYKKVRFLGLPLYETSHGSGLFSMLLDDNRPLREEDAYCNMYVFRSQQQAKLFQDGVRSASQLSYDVDYSTLGTQSCNGRIPAKGSKTIYLAFENERVRYSNYIWVEVMVAVPITEYHSTRYTIE